jgi:hypothetical protein
MNSTCKKTPFLATWALLFLHLVFTVRTENINFIEDYLLNIHTKFNLKAALIQVSDYRLLGASGYEMSMMSALF